MFKEYFLIYLLAHMLGDFYFQNDRLAVLKNNKISKLFLHMGIYLLAYIVVIVPIFSSKMFISIIVVASIHALIDLGKCCFIKHNTERKGSARTIYIVDQAIHIASLVLVAYYMTVNNVPIYLLNIFDKFLNVLGVGEIEMLSALCMVLFVLKPTNITIKQLLSKYKPEECIMFTKKDDRNTGEFIGILERLIIYILLLMNQISAIGLVLTAKSVARYNKISEDKDFAEYYLLGTLLSTMLVVVMFKLIY